MRSFSPVLLAAVLLAATASPVLADMTAFLASDLSAYTTGTIVTIDGGMIYGGTLF